MGHRFSKETPYDCDGTTTATAIRLLKSSDNTPQRAVREAAEPATAATSASVVQPTISLQIEGTSASSPTLTASATTTTTAAVACSPAKDCDAASGGTSPTQIIIKIKLASMERQQQQQQQLQLQQAACSGSALALDANANVSRSELAAADEHISNLLRMDRLGGGGDGGNAVEWPSSSRYAAANNNNNNTIQESSYSGAKPRTHETVEYCEVLSESAAAALESANQNRVERRRHTQANGKSRTGEARSKQPKGALRKAISSIFEFSGSSKQSGKSKDRSSADHHHKHSKQPRVPTRPVSLSTATRPTSSTTAPQPSTVRHSLGTPAPIARAASRPRALAAAATAVSRNVSAIVSLPAQQEQQQQQVSNVIIPLFMGPNMTCSIHLMPSLGDVAETPADMIRRALKTATTQAHQTVSSAPAGSNESPIFHSQADFVHYLVPDLEQITNTSYYWGKIDRYEAERLLEGKAEGTFLLRDSAQEEYIFSVTFRKYGRSLHARIEQRGHKFSFDCHDPMVFDSATVTGLLKHYRDPTSVMFFEPLLTIPLHRRTTFSLQQLCRASIASHVTYDGINELELPGRLKTYLKEYHYKQKIRVTLRVCTDFMACT